MVFEIHKAKRRFLSRRQQYYGVLLANNGEPILTSETEYNKADVIGIVEAIEKEFGHRGVIKIVNLT